MRPADGAPGGKLGGKVVACGVAMLLAAGLAMRAAEALAAGRACAAALQGAMSVCACAAAYALWSRMKRASDERVRWEIRTGRRDAGGNLRRDDDAE